MNLIRQFKFFYPEIVWIGIRTRLFSAGPGSNLQSVKVIRQDINPPSKAIIFQLRQRIQNSNFLDKQRTPSIVAGQLNRL